MALCGGYVAVQTELEVLVLKLDATSEPIALDESQDVDKIGNDAHSFISVCCLLQYCVVFRFQAVKTQIYI